MSLKFAKIGVDVVDHDYRPDPDDTWIWTKVRLAFMDENEIMPSVKVHVPTPTTGSETVESLRDAAVAGARTILQAALAALDKHSYAELVAQHRAVDTKSTSTDPFPPVIDVGVTPS